MSAELPLPDTRPPMTPARFASTLFGVGLIRPAPGTWGSLAVLPLGLLGTEWCLALATLLAVGGWVAVRTVLREAGTELADPGWVVIDEGAGQLIALAALPVHPTGFGILLAFLLFRLFDISKPGPVGWADRMHGATGVMLDDLIAGAIAAAVLLALGHWLPPEAQPGFFSLGVLH